MSPPQIINWLILNIEDDLSLYLKANCKEKELTSDVGVATQRLSRYANLPSMSTEPSFRQASLGALRACPSQCSIARKRCHDHTTLIKESI